MKRLSPIYFLFFLVILFTACNQQKKTELNLGFEKLDEKGKATGWIYEDYLPYKVPIDNKISFSGKNSIHIRNTTGVISEIPGGASLELLDLEDKKLHEFWHRLLRTFKTNHMMVIPPEGVQVAWRVRSCNTSELTYEEVRRLDIYNPSSYKRKFSFQLPPNFRLLKVLDEEKVTFKHGQKEVDIELLPEGSLSLDFGVFS